MATIIYLANCRFKGLSANSPKFRDINRLSLSESACCGDSKVRGDGVRGANVPVIKSVSVQRTQGGGLRAGLDGGEGLGQEPGAGRAAVHRSGSSSSSWLFR